jgi:hypothetical protein
MANAFRGFLKPVTSSNYNRFTNSRTLHLTSSSRSLGVAEQRPPTLETTLDTYASARRLLSRSNIILRILETAFSERTKQTKSNSKFCYGWLQSVKFVFVWDPSFVPGPDFCYPQPVAVFSIWSNLYGERTGLSTRPKWAVHDIYIYNFKCWLSRSHLSDSL